MVEYINGKRRKTIPEPNTKTKTKTQINTANIHISSKPQTALEPNTYISFSPNVNQKITWNLMIKIPKKTMKLMNEKT